MLLQNIEGEIRRGTTDLTTIDGTHGEYREKADMGKITSNTQEMGIDKIQQATATKKSQLPQDYSAKRNQKFPTW